MSSVLGAVSPRTSADRRFEKSSAVGQRPSLDYSDSLERARATLWPGHANGTDRLAEPYLPSRDDDDDDQEEEEEEDAEQEEQEEEEEEEEEEEQDAGTRARAKLAQQFGDDDDDDDDTPPPMPVQKSAKTRARTAPASKRTRSATLPTPAELDSQADIDSIVGEFCTLDNVSLARNELVAFKRTVDDTACVSVDEPIAWPRAELAAALQLDGDGDAPANLERTLATLDAVVAQRTRHMGAHHVRRIGERVVSLDQDVLPPVVADDDDNVQRTDGYKSLRKSQAGLRNMVVMVEPDPIPGGVTCTEAVELRDPRYTGLACGRSANGVCQVYAYQCAFFWLRAGAATLSPAVAGTHADGPVPPASKGSAAAARGSVRLVYFNATTPTACASMKFGAHADYFSGEPLSDAEPNGTRFGSNVQLELRTFIANERNACYALRVTGTTAAPSSSAVVCIAVPHLPTVLDAALTLSEADRALFARNAARRAKLHDKVHASDKVLAGHCTTTTTTITPQTKAKAKAKAAPKPPRKKAAPVSMFQAARKAKTTTTVAAVIDKPVPAKKRKEPIVAMPPPTTLTAAGKKRARATDNGKAAATMTTTMAELRPYACAVPTQRGTVYCSAAAEFRPARDLRVSLHTCARRVDANSVVEMCSAVLAARRRDADADTTGRVHDVYAAFDGSGGDVQHAMDAALAVHPAALHVACAVLDAVFDGQLSRRIDALRGAPH